MNENSNDEAAVCEHCGSLIHGTKLVDIVIDAPEGVTVNVTVNGVLTTHKPLASAALPPTPS